MDKAPDAFRTISEVADDLDLPQHVLRFWETRFSQIRPMKRGGGRRYYRPDDVELLRGIRHLLYGEGYTIKGVQRILKEQGVRFVMEIWRNPGMPIPTERPAGGKTAGPRSIVEEAPEAPEALEAPVVDEPDDGDMPPEEPPMARTREPEITTPAAAAERAASPAPAERAAEPADEPLPAGILPEDAAPRTGFRLMSRLRGGASAGEADRQASQPGAAGLSREDIRRLQATLFELLECKRLLDQAR